MGILDALGVVRAHFVGLSMGGGIAQRVAVDHPERVSTVCLISTSPEFPAEHDRGLPPPSPRVMAALSDPAPEPDWSDRDAVVTYRVEAERPFAGSIGFDESRFRRLAAEEVRRSRDMAASMTNHFLLDDGTSAAGQLAAITAPALVVHGTADPLLPIEHGQALVAGIAGARLLPLAGVGHEQPPPPLWDRVVSALVEHTARR